MKNQNPFDDNSRKERSISASLFVIVVSFIVILIHVIPMPKRTSVSQTLETLVLESIAIAVDVSEEINLEESDEEETSVEDIDELLSSFLIENPVDVTQSETEIAIRESNNSDQKTEFNFDFGTGDENVFGSGFAEDLPQVERRQGRSLRPTVNSGFVSDTEVEFGSKVVLEEDLTSEREVLDSIYEGLDRSSLTEEEVAHEDAVVLWIAEKKDLEPNPVISAWLKLETTDMFFKDKALLEDELYTVMLAYSPVNRVLKITLIKDNELFYFINPGLQNRANYFERGHVEIEDNKIVMVESEEQSVQSEDALRIFNLFTSWFKNEIE